MIGGRATIRPGQRQIPPDQDAWRILDGLIELRKRGELFGVWCDQMRIRVKYTAWDDLIPINWAQAQEMVWPKKIPPQRSITITGKTASTFRVGVANAGAGSTTKQSARRSAVGRMA